MILSGTEAGIFDNLLRIFGSLNSPNLTLDGLPVFISKSSFNFLVNYFISAILICL